MHAAEHGEMHAADHGERTNYPARWSVSLTHLLDVSPAEWLTAHPQPWMRLATFGPSVFEAYARLRIIPDPTTAGQRETDHTAPVSTASELDQLRVLARALSAWTTTPDDAYHCLWDGWGDLHGGDAVATLGEPGRVSYAQAQPAFPASVLDGPRVRHEHRAYYLFRGPLSELGRWGATEVAHGVGGNWVPAFFWPADHAWCVAFDIDPHWAGIGGSEAAITALVRDLAVTGLLDVVPADPHEPQPWYG